MFSVEKIAQIVQGELILGAGGTPTRVIHDSRLVCTGDLFVALAGQRSDGHHHLAEAFDRGACGAIVSDTSSLPDKVRNLIVVKDPSLALQQMASAWRDVLHTATFIAITGSNGKTTVKSLLGHLLAAHKSTYVSPGNYNTEIGLPISLLSMPSGTHFGVFELGAERPGDIELLARILRPSLGIITSVGASHLDGFDSIDTVAHEKWSLIDHLPESGMAVINADSEHLLQRLPTTNRRVVSVGLVCGDIRGRTLQTVPNLQIALDEHNITLDCALIGGHHATNVLLAAAAANTLGMDWEGIRAQMLSFTPIPHRLSALSVPFGTILDDTYNANPASMTAALHVLASFGNDASTKLFIFGQMAGLGASTERYHREIVRLVLSLPIDVILPVGQAAIAACVSENDSRIVLVPREQIRHYARQLTPPITILVKGSRNIELENLVEDLLTNC